MNEWKDFATIAAKEPYEFSVTGLTPGELYSITVTAINEHGEGPESDMLISIAGDQPSQPTPIITSEDKAFIKLTWLAPDDNFLPITNYET